MKGPGFYWLDTGSTYLNFSNTSVCGPGYSLDFERRFEYSYPVGAAGIRYFENEADARIFYGLPPAPLDWAPNTAFAAGDKVRTDSGRLLIVVTPGVTGENPPEGYVQLINDGDVQFAYIGICTG